MESMSIYDEQDHALMNHKLPSISLLPQLDNQEEYDTKNDSKVATLSHTSPQHCLKPSMSTSSNNSDSSQGHSIPTPSSFLPPPYIHKDHQDMDCTYSNVVSPPLTPAVSPSSMLYDAMHMKRKYSVDVGPFAFSSSMVNQASVAASAFNTDMYQDAYRRHSMCSEMSLDDYTQHNGHHFSMPVPSPQPMGDASKNRRESTSSGRGTAKPSQSSAHKHICKYPYCGWSFKRYEHLKRHMLVHTGERPHLCDFPGCGKSFSRSDNFAAHYRTHTKKTLLQHRSSISSIDTMQQQHQQQQHQNNGYFRHNKMPPNFDFTRTYELYSDRQGFPTSEMQTTPEMIQQQHYFRSFESLHAVGSSPFHSSPMGKLEFMHMHQPSSPTSPTAPSGLSSSLQQPDNADVYMPMNTMTSSQQYKTHACQECRKRFKRLEHLKRHMRTHTLERPFSCPVTGCGKSFSRSDNLSQHVKTHQRHQYRERTAAAQGTTAVSSNVWENATTVHC